MFRSAWIALAFAFGMISIGPAFAGTAPQFKKVMVIVFENTDYSAALGQPFFAKVASQGTLLDNFYAETHPSQPNYIALTSGSENGVISDDTVNVDARNLADLLEEHGRTWKVYAEDYPGGCFLGARSGKYARKHVPFLSYTDIQSRPERCARVVPATQLQADIQSGSLPDFSFYVPGLDDDGHDTDVAFADRWFSGFLPPLLQDSRFSQGMLIVATFDESTYFGGNHIYTALLGDSVVPGSRFSGRASHYSLLRMVEDAWNLGSLDAEDARAVPITGVWK